MTWSLLTPANVPGAVAIVQLQGEAAAIFKVLAMPLVANGRVGVRDALGVDRALVACVSSRCVQIMPHGGSAVVRELLRALCDCGIAESEPLDPRTQYPEARTEIEARMVAVLSRAASPRAVDVLLSQPERWKQNEAPQISREHAAALEHLITPPIVAAVGPANIGKSTLLNTLAGRQVAIAADEPGTTRDHVGVLLDVDGLTIRYVDTPGMRDTDDEIERAAQANAMEVARNAAMVLLVADASSLFVPWSPLPEQVVLHVGLRSDLGPIPGAALKTSARTGDGIEPFARAIRQCLVPDAALLDPGRWQFWQD
jgi:tRNA U34 5-carboxymethylaminomethyl modifying GTPase MnmE/TrmE